MTYVHVRTPEGTRMPIELPRHLHWHGTEGELAALVQAVYNACQEPTSKTPTGMCLKEGVANVCSLCAMLNDQKLVDKLLWGKHTMSIRDEYADNPRLAEDSDFPYEFTPLVTQGRDLPQGHPENFLNDLPDVG